MSLPFIHPFTATVSGPTGCGKTDFVFRLLENADRMIAPSPENFFYCYDVYQNRFSKHPHITFHEGLPDIEWFDGSRPSLLVIDDLMDEANEGVVKLFTKVSHHRNVSVIFVTQNLFPKNKHARSISLNSHYFVLFKNPRDVGQFSVLARQMYPTSWQFAVDAFRDATRLPYGYLLIDLKPETDEKYRLRTTIFPGEYTHVYLKK
jgi:hypothetical protein